MGSRFDRLKAAYLVPAVLMGATFAEAQPLGNQPEGKRESTAAAPRRADAVNPNTESAGGDRKPPKSGSASASIAINDVFASITPSGCTYSATMRGTIRQIRSSSGEDVRYAPDLMINAWVTCGGKTTLRLLDSVLREGPLTTAELEQAVATRAMLLSGAGPKRCAYAPLLGFTDNHLGLELVDYLCALHANTGAGAAPDAPDSTPTASDETTPSGAEAWGRTDLASIPIPLATVPAAVIEPKTEPKPADGNSSPGRNPQREAAPAPQRLPAAEPSRDPGRPSPPPPSPSNRSGAASPPDAQPRPIERRPEPGPAERPPTRASDAQTGKN